jgi:poly(3-hydroxybutyrate) depolymerase
MKPERWSIAPTVLGLVLLASAAADGHTIVILARDDDWRLFVRFELEFLSGLWLLGGLLSRWARITALTAFMGILAYDVVATIASYSPRHGFARVAVGPGWILFSDLIIVFALFRWRPASCRAARIDSHPWRLAGTALIAVVVGVAVDWSQVGQFPIMATAWSGGASSSQGLDYLVYLPEGYYRSLGRWPLIFALHGSGATGRDIERVRREGLPRHVEAEGGLPFIVVAPQNPRGGWEVSALDALLDDILKRYRIDAERVYLTGESMGGYGTWAFAAAHPERFAAIAPICGGGDPAWADRLRGVPTWAFHGAEDRVVLPEESRKMVAAIRRAGGDARLTTYGDIGHDAWTATFADPGLYAWLLAHRRRAAERDAKSSPTPSSSAR